MTNFTPLDIIGTLFGTFCYSLLLIPPGYLIGYISGLFEFNERTQISKIGISILLSCALTPVLFFILYRYLGLPIVLGTILITLIIFFQIAIRQSIIPKIINEIKITSHGKFLAFASVAWTMIACISLVDLQINNSLYFNITAYDYQTRVLVIDAVTRTGVPPLNPSYFPGTPSLLTFLYYYWYVLCSLVDSIGMDIVTARTSLISSAVWAGLATIALIAFYIRTRNNPGKDQHHASSIMGISLLAISGLDIIGSTFYIYFPNLLYGFHIDGDIEHWNEQITAWVGTAFWTPHHLTALVICVFAWVTIRYHENKFDRRRVFAGVVAGISFSSALGLSSWVTLVFIFFWVGLIIHHVLSGKPLRDVWMFLLPGIIAAIASLPFITDLLGSGSTSQSTQAIAFDVRWFRPIIVFIYDFPGWLVSIINLTLLPINYFLELGFFFVAGAIWINLQKNKLLEDHRYKIDEQILLVISVLLTSFFRSTLIANNDLGWRGWLPAQFVLLVWGAETISFFWNNPEHDKLSQLSHLRISRIRAGLSTLLIIGLLTTLDDLIQLRTWPIIIDHKLVQPNEFIKTDEYLGTKNYEARELFQLIDGFFPESTLVQFNPSVGLNRPTGLYRTRAAVFSYHSLYGIPEDEYTKLGRNIVQIFNERYTNWNDIDEYCHLYKINILIINSEDQLWENVSELKSTRSPIFLGDYYTAFECG